MEALYENPYTVDAGHFQVETYPFGYRRQEEGSGRNARTLEGWTFAPVNLRLGILNNLDAQLALAPYTVVRIKDHHTSEVEQHRGFGDIVPRVRVNLWGNDGGKTAFAITPFLKIPTNQDGLGNDAWEGGMVFALAAELPLAWWIVVTPEIDVVADSYSGGYHPEGAGTFYLWHSIVGQLSGYVEFAARASAEPAVPWIGTVDVGLTYMLTPNIQLDAGTPSGSRRPLMSLILSSGSRSGFSDIWIMAVSPSTSAASFVANESTHRSLDLPGRHSQPAIQVRGLTKHYQTFKKQPGLLGAVKSLFRRTYESTTAAAGINFDIEPGELVGFLGPNGAGKTTTLKLLAGLLHPTSGSASVLGFTPWERRVEYRRQFALLLGQKNQLWWDLPAHDSLELNAKIYGIERREFERTLGELTEILDVKDKLNVMVRELSLGERMKMEMIAALLHRPRCSSWTNPPLAWTWLPKTRSARFSRPTTPPIAPPSC